MPEMKQPPSRHFLLALATVLALPILAVEPVPITADEVQDAPSVSWKGSGLPIAIGVRP